MIVGDIMTTRLVVVTPDMTLAHAANMLRQHQFHHLPVVRMPAHTAQWYGYEMIVDTKQSARASLPLLEGLLTSQDIELASAVDAARFAGGSPAATPPDTSWQEQHVAAVMNQAIVTITPSTSVAAAAQLLVERGLNCLPVVEYTDPEADSLLVGLLTRSDLLLAFARSLGIHEPGVEVHIPCPAGDLTPLAQALLLAAELHIAVRSSMAAPLDSAVPYMATIRLGTIYPAPLFVRLREAHIEYRLTDTAPEGDFHA